MGLIKWARTRASVAKTFVCQKFESDETMRKALLDTGDRNIVCMSRNDKVWGIGQHDEAATATPYRQDHRFDPTSTTFHMPTTARVNELTVRRITWDGKTGQLIADEAVTENIVQTNTRQNSSGTNAYPTLLGQR